MAEVQKKLEEVMRAQQDIALCLGSSKWDSVNTTNTLLLKKRIGFAFFGAPTNDSTALGYSGKEESKILKLSELTYKHMNTFSDKYIAFVFIYGIRSSLEIYKSVLIRIPDGNNLTKYLFIDSDLRIYKGWNDFMSSNTLPKSVICYPKDGIYTFLNDQAVLVVSETEGSGITGALDVMGSILAGGSAVVSIAALASPLAAPLLVGSLVTSATVGVYQMGRSIYILDDRRRHSQTIGLSSPEARGAWLGIVGAPLAVAASGGALAANKLAQSADVSSGLSRFFQSSNTPSGLSKLGQVGLQTTVYASYSTSLLGVACGISNIAQKIHRKESVSNLDILEVVASVLFFSNAVISTHQARVLLQNIPAQQQLEATSWICEKFKNLSNIFCEGVVTVKMCFDYMFRDEIFNGIVIPALGCAAVHLGLSTKMTEFCIDVCSFVKRIVPIIINGALSKNIILKDFHNLASQLYELYSKFLDCISKEIEESCFGKMRMEVSSQGKSKVAGALLSESWDHGHKVIKPEQMVSFSTEGYRKDVMKVVTETSLFQDCKSHNDIVKYTKFIGKFLNQEVEKKEADYHKAFEAAKDCCPDLQESVFNQKVSGSKSLFAHLFEEVVMEYSSEVGFKGGFLKLKVAYAQQKELNKMNSSNVELNTVHHENDVQLMEFCKEGVARKLSELDYVQIVNKSLGTPVSREMIQIYEDGDSTLLQCCNPSLPYNVIVLIDSCYSHESCSGIVALMKVRK